MIDTNFPPRDLLTGEALREQLQDQNLELQSRADVLLAAAERVPPTIEDEDTAQKAGDFIKQLTALHKAAETARVGAKEPYLEGSRGVDGFFKAITSPIERAKWKVEGILARFLREKEQRARAEREAQARAAREAEAKRRAEAEAAEAGTRAQAEAQARAKQATADAVEAEQAAAVKPAELSRTRGEYGSVASLRVFWTFKDLDRNKLDLRALRPHLSKECMEQAVRSFIKAGGRQLKGVEIYETTEAVVR